MPRGTRRGIEALRRRNGHGVRAPMTRSVDSGRPRAIAAPPPPGRLRRGVAPQLPFGSFPYQLVLFDCSSPTMKPKGFDAAYEADRGVGAAAKRVGTD